MDLLAKSDEEIFAIAKPFWENLVRASNMKDYGGFTKDFSTQMLFGANEVELGKQWACLLYTSPSPRDLSTSRMPSSA